MKESQNISRRIGRTVRANLKKITLVAAAVLLLIGFVAQLAMPTPATADKYDDQIKKIQQEIEGYNSRAKELAEQADSLSNTIETLRNQQSQVQAEIDLTETKVEELNAAIAENEEKIKKQGGALSDTMADMYFDQQISPLEMLASSNSLSDYVDKQARHATVQEQLNSSIKQISALKQQLKQQKTDVEKLLKEQQAQRNTLAASRKEQQTLLDRTQGQEETYKELVGQAKKKQAEIHAAQQEYLRSLSNSGKNSDVIGSFSYRNFSGNSGCGGGGYPYCGAQDSYFDPWRLYNRECVSYAAWAISERFDKKVSAFNGEGNAYEWAFAHPERSQGSAIYYSGAWRVDNPQAGDAVVLPITPRFAPVGHLMVVESVLSDGWVKVSQYNFGGTGMYSTMEISKSGVVFLRFPNK